MGFKGKPAFKARSGAKPRFERDRPAFSRPSARPGRLELFDATCEKCGKETQVPFRPTGGKPVYCRDCFKGNDGAPARPTGSGDLAEINRKLDRIMKALKIE